jgi:hypothetical protein
MSRPFQHFRRGRTGGPGMGHTSQDLLQILSLRLDEQLSRSVADRTHGLPFTALPSAKREFKLRANDYLNVRNSAHLAGAFRFS